MINKYYNLLISLAGEQSIAGLDFSNLQPSSEADGGELSNQLRIMEKQSNVPAGDVLWSGWDASQFNCLSDVGLTPSTENKFI